jgi:hypothetical protein
VVWTGVTVASGAGVTSPVVGAVVVGVVVVVAVVPSATAGASA